MPKLMTREEFETPEGRKRAWRSLFLEDHGFLRKVYENSHQITDEMWRTYQPSPKDIRKWAKRGIRTVINLRGLRGHKGGIEQPGFYWLEEEACREAGLTLINHRAYSREAPSVDFILGIDELFRTITYPAIMHCKSGADRAGIGSTLYMFLRAKRPLDEALKQLSFKYGHVKSGKTGVLDHFFTVYKAAAEKQGAEPTPEHFLNWVQTDYDQDEVKRTFKSGTVGNMLTEVILRRE